MKTLIIDSATSCLYVSLLIDNVSDAKYINGKNDHAKYIVSSIDELLKSHNLKAKDLDEIICGIGPGSYTGVRMAVSVAKMMAVFLNIPLYSISTLALMSSNTKGKVLVEIDARRDHVFASIIDNNKEEYILKDSYISRIDLYKTDYDIKITEDNFIVNDLYCMKHKTRVKEPHLLVPNYLRDTEAERNLNDKKI